MDFPQASGPVMPMISPAWALKETLEKYLVDAKDISAADRERVQKLADSIHENDNNYILYAKLK